MKAKKILLAAAFATIVPAAMAQPETNAQMTAAPGKATMSHTVKLTATVVGIEPDTRTVTLKGKNGKVIQVEVGEEARNFDQLKVGDVVNAEYKEAITLSLKKGSGLRSGEASQTVDRTPPGAKPGGTVARQVTIMADVTAVNAKTKTVTLKGPQGNTVDVVVEDPNQLKNIKKGDQVQAVYTEAFAISVEPAANK
jgi:hypothetical protein